MKLLILSNLLFFFLLFISSASDSLKIIFSKSFGSENYEKYPKYFKKIDPNIECINAYGTSLTELYKIIEDADGLVLTGGPDVHPKFYDQEADTSYCDIDPYRDSLEFALLDFAFKNQIPIFAICRGFQILNVYLGGSLFPDIPIFFGTKVEHRCDYNINQCKHEIKIIESSSLFNLLGKDTLLVNSFHHQGVNRLGKGLKASAMAFDGLIEAYEWEEPGKKPFFIAVQWHPERLDSADSSILLAKKFIEAVKMNRKESSFQKR